MTKSTTMLKSRRRLFVVLTMWLSSCPLVPGRLSSRLHEPPAHHRPDDDGGWVETTARFRGELQPPNDDPARRRLRHSEFSAIDKDDEFLFKHDVSVPTQKEEDSSKSIPERTPAVPTPAPTGVTFGGHEVPRVEPSENTTTTPLISSKDDVDPPFSDAFTDNDVTPIAGFPLVDFTIGLDQRLEDTRHEDFTRSVENLLKIGLVAFDVVDVDIFLERQDRHRHRAAALYRFSQGVLYLQVPPPKNDQITSTLRSVSIQQTPLPHDNSENRMISPQDVHWHQEQLLNDVAFVQAALQHEMDDDTLLVRRAYTIDDKKEAPHKIMFGLGGAAIAWLVLSVPVLFCCRFRVVRRKKQRRQRRQLHLQQQVLQRQKEEPKPPEQTQQQKEQQKLKQKEEPKPPEQQQQQQQQMEQQQPQPEQKRQNEQNSPEQQQPQPEQKRQYEQNSPEQQQQQQQKPPEQPQPQPEQPRQNEQNSPQQPRQQSKS